MYHTRQASGKSATQREEPTVNDRKVSESPAADAAGRDPDLALYAISVAGELTGVRGKLLTISVKPAGDPLQKFAYVLRVSTRAK